MIDPDDLALLATSFDAAMRRSPGPAAADAALVELGWRDVLAESPRQGAAAAFTALGATGAGACLLDDVITQALGSHDSSAPCVVLPSPHRSDVPGRLLGSVVRIDGVVSARVESVDLVLVPVDDGDTISLMEFDAASFRRQDPAALESERTYRAVAGLELELRSARGVLIVETWTAAVGDARAALAHQLVAASRSMLEQARVHALERVQFGRPVSSFQAVRHKLAEAFVAIEGAATVAGACSDDGCDALTTALAKSLAGRAARLTAVNSQQVLAGIGFTTDHPFHRSLKRVMVLDTLFGSARSLPIEIGRALIERRGAPRLVDL